MINDQQPVRNPVRSFSYGFNWYVSRNQKTFHDFKKPSSMAMITEENPFLIGSLYRHSFNDGFVLLGPRSPTYIDGIATFHNAGSYSNLRPEDGFANVLWLDGHVSLGDINHINDIMRDE
jgi:prepilin-type processing-associated H-X9-DG protein